MPTPDLRDLLITTLSTELGLDPKDFATDRTFASYGVDSLTAMSVAVILQDELNIPQIPPTLMWDCPTVDELVPAVEELMKLTELPGGVA
jgi:acyl carrier protein